MSAYAPPGPWRVSRQPTSNDGPGTHSIRESAPVKWEEKDVPVCASCRNDLEEGKRFCGDCGAAVVALITLAALSFCGFHTTLARRPMLGGAGEDEGASPR